MTDETRVAQTTITSPKSSELKVRHTNRQVTRLRSVTHWRTSFLGLERRNVMPLGQRNSSGNRRSSQVSLIFFPLCRSAFLTIYGNHSSKVTVCFSVRIPILNFDRMKCHRHLSVSQALEGEVSRYLPSSATMSPCRSASESTGLSTWRK